MDFGCICRAVMDTAELEFIKLNPIAYEIDMHSRLWKL
jgi:hypothetical protein